MYLAVVDHSVVLCLVACVVHCAFSLHYYQRKIQFHFPVFSSLVVYEEIFVEFVVVLTVLILAVEVVVAVEEVEVSP